MTAVSDTGPLSYLNLIGRIDLIPAIFGSVVIPVSVHTELSDPGAPSIVRTWAANLPGWTCVQNAPSLGWELVSGLDRGEAEAILLSSAIRAERLLIDELKARRRALTLGLAVTGTLGILLVGHERGLVNLPDALADLDQTNFRITPALRESILRRSEVS